MFHLGKPLDANRFEHHGLRQKDFLSRSSGRYSEFQQGITGVWVSLHDLSSDVITCPQQCHHSQERSEDDLHWAEADGAGLCTDIP